jgi:aminomethyltransferase
MTAKRTALYAKHVELGAKIVEFAGWEMPILYSGVIEEHKAVREKIGIFDVSHMGRISVSGPEAEKFLDFLSTNKVTGKSDGSAVYSVWCHENGGSVDDVIVYRESMTQFFVVVNAGNRNKDLQHMLHYAKNFNVAVQDLFNEGAIIAIQGKFALDLQKILFPETVALKFMHFQRVNFEGESIIISRTGYTGSPGFEIYCSNHVVNKLWDQAMSHGAQYGIAPIGLGARDTLRLEMGYALYGHELTDEILPIESVSAWTVKLDKGPFIGSEALKRGSPRHEIALQLTGPGVPREGYPVLLNGKTIGTITSGTMSPSLSKGIAIALVEINLSKGQTVDVQIRKNQVPAEVVSLPFVSLK